jgi:hypothetical protein
MTRRRDEVTARLEAEMGLAIEAARKADTIYHIYYRRSKSRGLLISLRSASSEPPHDSQKWNYYGLARPDGTTFVF